MAKQLPESSSGGEMSGGSILGSVISPAMPFSVLALESRHRHLPDRQANLQQTPWDLPNGSLFWKLQQEESSMDCYVDICSPECLYESFEEEARYFQFATAITLNDIDEI
nr:uncharacterized protein LOC125418209 isoform X2 [Ziziphus jujuba var. spinosa]XP_048323051.1 uncharacterized protein LOC125418209 isoform X2 [Ziziphus jujuba var. spinosa]